MQDAWGFLVIWDFRVVQGKEAEFEQIYGREGVWAEFFRTGLGFVSTELVRDSNVARRYVTLDLWSSQQAYEEFRQKNAERYHSIDAQCEAMTENELEIGRFIRMGSSQDKDRVRS